MRLTAGTEQRATRPSRSGRRTARALVAIAAVIAGPLALAPGAGAQVNAGVGMSVTPLFPPTINVGDNAVDVGLFITNASAGVGPVTLSTITLDPSCKDTSPGACSSPDLGVFTLSATGSGATAGDACEGKTFTISGPDGTGRYTFTPDTPVVLAQTGSGATSTCAIAFTVNVVKAPTADADPGAAGTQTRQFATVNGSAQTTAQPVSTLNGTGTGTSITTIKAAPTITTAVASGSIVPGGSAQDSATLAGLANPTNAGTITFTLYGPNDATCTGTPAFTSTKPVDHGNGVYTSDAFQPTALGTYRFVASYSGDVNNAAVANPCTDASEAVVVGKTSPALTTRISGPVTLGGTVSDTATLSGGVSPTGTITFRFYGPADAQCTGTPVFTSTVQVNHGNGDYTSQAYTPPAAGSYTSIAAYSGDSANASVTTACIDANETTTVTAGPSPALRVVKTPSPTSRTVPGGTFSFTVVVTNTSAEAVTLSSLVDDVYGDLNGKGTCKIGSTLGANGGTYSCTFQGDFHSSSPASQTDTVTARVTDGGGKTATATAKATVRLTAAAVSLSTSTLARTGGNGRPILLAGLALLLLALGVRRGRRWADRQA